MRFIGNFFAGIVSLIYFAVLLVMSMALFASNLFSADYFSDVLKSIEFSEIKLSDLGIEGVEEGATVEDLLVDTLEEAGVSENDAKKILNSEEIKDVAGNFLSDTVTYIANQDGEIPQIKEKDVDRILQSEELKGLLQEVPDDIKTKDMTDEINNMIREMFEGGTVNVY